MQSNKKLFFVIAILPGKVGKLQFDTIHLGMIMTSDVSITKPQANNNLVPSYSYIGEMENVVFNPFLLIDR